MAFFPLFFFDIIYRRPYYIYPAWLGFAPCSKSRAAVLANPQTVNTGSSAHFDEPQDAGGLPLLEHVDVLDAFGVIGGLDETEIMTRIGLYK